jgi:RNA polymerase sigma factor (sigma-70 family)
MTYRTNKESDTMLTDEEEVVLGRAVQAGIAAKSILDSDEAAEVSAADRRKLRNTVKMGENARNKFVEHNLRLAMQTAHRYHKAQPAVDYEDLIQEATLGIFRAVEKFDPERGFKFSTYATWWCRQACQRAVANQARSIRLPMHIETDVRKLQKASDEYEAAHGMEPDLSKLAEISGFDEERCEKLQGYLYVSQVASYDAPSGDDSDSDSGSMSFLAWDRSAESVEDKGVKKSYSEEIRDAMAFLSDRERQVLFMRFGVGDAEPMSLQAVGDRLSLTRERVRQIEAKAISKLRHPSSGIVQAFLETD